MTVRDGGQNVGDRQRVVRREPRTGRDPFTTRAASQAVEALAGNVELVDAVDDVRQLAESADSVAAQAVLDAAQADLQAAQALLDAAAADAKAESADVAAAQAAVDAAEADVKAAQALLDAADADDKATQALAFATDLQSDNFQAGSAGWRILRGSGSAEFNDVTVRGSVESSVLSTDDGSGSGYVMIDGINEINRVTFFPPDDIPFTEPGEISIGTDGGLAILSQSTGFGRASIDVVPNRIDLIPGGGVNNGETVIFGSLLNLQAPIRVNRGNWPTTSSSSNVRVFTGDPAGFARMALVTSKRAFKNDIQDASLDSEDVLRLRPVTFRDRAEEEENPDGAATHLGLIAEEVADLGIPGLVDWDADGEPLSVNYDRIAVALLDVVKNLAGRVAALEATVSDGSESEE